MKKYLILFTFLVYSCVKGNDDGCEHIIHGSPEVQLVSDKQLDTIKILMTNNQIDYSNLQFWQYANMGAAILISAYQYVNGLKVFNYDISFWQIKDETSIRMYGSEIANLNESTTRLMSPKEVKNIFLKRVANDEIMRQANIEIGNCIDLEFGYYNLNRHDIILPENFVTVWRVTPKGKIYPWAFINDRNGDILDYWDGICSK